MRADTGTDRRRRRLAGVRSRLERLGVLLRRHLPGPVRSALRPVRSRWRRSLQLRVVAATVALGLVVIVVVGQFVLKRISDGLVNARVAGVANESLQQYRYTQGVYARSSFGDENEFASWLGNLVTTLGAPTERESRWVIAVKSRPSETGLTDRGSPGIQPSVIPAELRARVVADPDTQKVQLLTLPVTAPDGSSTRTIRAITVGTQIDFGAIGDGRWELYFVYDLDRELTDLALVQRTFLAGGVALLLLVGASAWVVTRQVVTPVRQAARAAEQLASGRLDRRMRVRGEDELARLGRGFNEMAASLERQILQLEELSRVQRRFVSDVSHELRTPLTTIRMAGEVLYESREDFDPAVARTAELLQTQLDRFEVLLADLLEVSRFDAGAAVLETEALDVRELVHRVVEGLRPLSDRKGGRLDTLVPAVACVADVDPRRVERVVRNLVGNAIEHGEGRPVLVTVAADDEAVAVSVRDHGVGLASHELRMVFNRFWRADPARARTTGGTGLGLAIALEDAHLHGGWLQVWGEPGRGANFRLTLPRRAGVLLAGSPLPLVPPDEPAAPTPVEPPAQRRTALEVGPASTAATATAATAVQPSGDPEVAAPVPGAGASADGVRVRP